MNITDFGVTGVAAITVICFLVGQFVKDSMLDNKWIPVICGSAGGLLGVVGMHTMNGFPASDYLTAVAVGVVSGFAATGLNQAVKQLNAKE